MARSVLPLLLSSCISAFLRWLRPAALLFSLSSSASASTSSSFLLHFISSFFFFFNISSSSSSRWLKGLCAQVVGVSARETSASFSVGFIFCACKAASARAGVCRCVCGCCWHSPPPPLPNTHRTSRGVARRNDSKRKKSVCIIAWTHSRGRVLGPGTHVALTGSAGWCDWYFWPWS